MGGFWGLGGESTRTTFRGTDPTPVNLSILIENSNMLKKRSKGKRHCLNVHVEELGGI